MSSYEEEKLFDINDEENNLIKRNNNNNNNNNNHCNNILTINTDTEWKHNYNFNNINNNNNNNINNNNITNKPKIIVSRQDVINQGKCLFGQYIRARVRRAGLFNRKVTQRLRAIVDVPTTAVVQEVFPAINGLGEELERMHPRLYTNISRQISRAPFGELTDSDTAPFLLHFVAKEIFKNDITWVKIISFFAVSGGLAVDCIRQGHYDYLQRLLEGTTDIMEEEIVEWIVESGGWLGLLEYIKPNGTEITILGWLTIVIFGLAGIYLLFSVIKVVGYQIYTTIF